MRGLIVVLIEVEDKESAASVMSLFLRLTYAVLPVQNQQHKNKQNNNNKKKKKKKKQPKKKNQQTNNNNKKQTNKRYLRGTGCT